MYTNDIFERNTLLFRKNRKVYPINVEEIVYMSKRNGITYVHLSDGVIKEYRYVSFIRIIRDSCNRNLFMCNKSTIVNIKYIYALDPTNGFAILKGKYGMLDIGIAYCHKILECFKKEYENLTEGKTVILRNHSIRYIIYLNEINYVESFDRYLRIHLGNGSELKISQKPIRYILDIANSDKLVSCARGIAVNIENVSDIDWTHHVITIKNGEKLKLGEKYIKELKQVWGKY